MEVNRYTSFVGAVGESKYTNSGDRALLWKTAILRIILKATQRVSQRVVVTENISKAVFTPLKIGLMEISCSRARVSSNTKTLCSKHKSTLGGVLHIFG